MGLKPHRPSDYPSFLLYVLDETHLTVTAFTASYILYTRSAHSAYFALGALGSSLTAKFVKRFIKSPRPPPPPPSTDAAKSVSAKKTHIRPKKTYGMPSTHSTALTFYFAYLFPILIQSIFSPSSSSSGSLVSPSSAGVTRVGSVDEWGVGWKALAAAGLGFYWVGGIWSRVELGYHTYPQCFGGVALGSVLAVVWKAVWEKNAWMERGLQRLIDLVWAETVARVL